MNSDERENTTSNVEVYETLEGIEATLQGSVPDDPRFQSGVVKKQDTDDLKFIEMSGLVTSEDIAAAPVTPAEIPYEFLQENIKHVQAQAEPAQPFPPVHEEQETQTRKPEAQQPASQVILEPPEERAPESQAHAVFDLPATNGEEAQEKTEETLLQELLQDSSSSAGDAVQDTQKSEKKAEEESHGEILIGGEKLSPGIMTDEDWTPLSHRSDLNEAEELVGALQAQIAPQDSADLDRETETPPPEETEPEPPSSFTLPQGTGTQPTNADKEEPRLNKETHRKKSSHTKRRTRYRRRVIRFAVVCCSLLVFAGAGFYAKQWFQRFTERPEVLLARAQRYAEKGDFPAAITAYDDFVRRYPDHPERGTAQFSIAFLRQAQTDKTRTVPENVYKKSIAEFEEFLREHPEHPKAARARTMIGLLNFRIGNYSKAIEILKDPELRLKDPVASLPILRTLARAYALSGDIPSAQASFLQAATLDTNPSPSLDYDELGNLYQTLSETTPVPENRLRYQRMALMYWEEAASFVGTSPTTRNALQHKIDLLREKLKAQENETNPSAENAPGKTDENVGQSSEGTPMNDQVAPEAQGKTDGTTASSSAEPTPSSPVAQQGEETP